MGRDRQPQQQGRLNSKRAVNGEIGQSPDPDEDIVRRRIVDRQYP